MAKVKFNATVADRARIGEIVDRAERMWKAERLQFDRQSVEMDITACHLNGCPLDLDKLLAAQDGSFGHDVFGIMRFIDRKTGKINPAKFDPRCSRPAQASAA